MVRHGYGRWQTIVEDKDLQIQHIICQEQNLPFLNGFGAAQFQNSATMANSEGTSSVQIKETGGLNDDQSGAGQGVEISNQTNLYQSFSGTYNFREMQRRLVEFIKKRVLLLEKALTAEYQKEYFVS